MGLRILTNDDGDQCFYCSTTMTAFGPVHNNADNDLEEFVQYLTDKRMSARMLTDTELMNQYYKWLESIEEEQEEDEDDDGEPVYDSNNMER